MSQTRATTPLRGDAFVAFGLAIVLLSAGIVVIRRLRRTASTSATGDPE